MNFAELEKYLSYCFDFKNIKILYLNSKLKSISNLNKFDFKSIEKFDKNQSYSINDILILFTEDLIRFPEILIYKPNFKIIILDKIELPIDKITDYKILYKSNFLIGIFRNSITVVQRNLSKKERELLWNNYYGYHLEKLYQDKKLDLIFYSGHKYISSINKKNLNVVDFGCGSGYHAEFENLNQINKYYFVDSNSETIKYLKNKGYKNVIQSSGTFEDLPDESIDYFICSHILEHIPNLEEVLLNIKKKLKTGGSIILVAPCDPGFLWNLLSKLSPNRNRLKILGLDYDEIMRSEHINSIHKVLLILNKYFAESRSTYFPFNLIRSTEANLMYFSIFQK